MVTVTLWLTIASGGSFLSSGMSSPAPLAELALARATTNTGRAYRRNRMAHLVVTRGLSQRSAASRPLQWQYVPAATGASAIMTRATAKAIGSQKGCYERVTGVRRRARRGERHRSADG